MNAKAVWNVIKMTNDIQNIINQLIGRKMGIEKGERLYKKGDNPNPKGNPNIGQERKTGPITDEGKLRSSIGAMSSGKYSKLLHKFKRCDKCPLGASTKVITVGGKEKEIKIPATCKFYMDNNNTECAYDHKEFIVELKDFFEMERLGEFNHAQMTEFEAFKAMKERDEIAFVERQVKGHPGFYANEYRKTILDALKNAHEMKYGKRSQIEVKEVKTFQDVLKEVQAEIVEEENEDKN